MTKLSQTHLWISIAAGVAFWFSGVLLIRFCAPIFVPGGPFLLPLFVATLLIAFVSVRIALMLVPVQGDAALRAITIMTVAAVCLDGIALTWMPSLYGLPTDRLYLGTAWLLWGAGLIFAVALYFPGGSVAQPSNAVE